jgi:predicted DNA-binding transcriptional regulator YafY
MGFVLEDAAHFEYQLKGIIREVVRIIKKILRLEQRIYFSYR